MADKRNTALGTHFLNTIMNEQAWLGRHLSTFGHETLTEAKGDINYLETFFKDILEGKNPEQLLDFINADDINESYANAENNAAQFGVRGGARAGILANMPFEKAGEIRNLIAGVKAKSPDALMQLAQLMGNLGGAGVSGGQNAYNTGLQAVMGALGLHENDKDRKAALIGNLISAGGRIAGAFAGGAGG